jgi:RNA polymerase sigma-70 factor (ECF subfamily)
MVEDDMSAAKPGRPDWVQEALERHGGPLTRYAAQLTGNLDTARDVVQDTFLRLCQADPAGVQGHLAEWLFTVCRNRALDVLRKESRMQPLSDVDLATCQVETPSPAAEAERRETTSEMLCLLASLPANQQEVVRLKFQNGLSYLEISRVTQLSVSNVGFLIHTAIRTLRKKLQAPALVPAPERRQP